MARVTVEDCLKNVKNRFELVLLAAKRARQLMRGKEPKVEWDNDKPTVVALREIALGFTDIDHHEVREEEPMLSFRETVTEQKVVAEDEDAADDMDMEEDIEIEVDIEQPTAETQEPSEEAHPSTRSEE